MYIKDVTKAIVQLKPKSFESHGIITMHLLKGHFYEN